MKKTLDQLSSKDLTGASEVTIKVGTLVTGSQTKPTQTQFVTINAGIVTDIRNEKEFAPDKNYIDASDYIVCPGLINAHTHVAMGFFRGLGVDADESGADQSMIETFLFPAEKSLTKDLVRDLSYSYIIQGIKSGVTTFFDHYYFSAGIAEAFGRIGARAYLAETIADIGGAFPSRDTWSRAKALVENWPFKEDLIQPILGPHACDTVSKSLFEEIADFNRTHNLPVHLHCSQTIGERHRVEKAHRCSPVQFLDQSGLLNERTLAVHLISADREDLLLLKDRGATAVYCPASQILYEKSAAFTLWRELGLPFAIATDCAASNDACDLMQECKIANLIIRHQDGQVGHIKAKDLFYAITEQPAKVMGAERKIGKVQVGGFADLVFIKKDISLLPLENVFNNLIYSHSAAFVEHVMIAGKLILQNRQIVSCSENDIKAAYSQAVARIRQLAQKTR